MKKSNHRILLYSADNAGIGHSSIGISLLSTLREAYPGLEFLVISSTGVPQRFLSAGVEVVKIPSLAPFKNGNGTELPYRPRYMENSSLKDCLRLRQSIIDAVFTEYQPTIVLVDHHVTGLNGELMTWLLRKQLGYCQFKCAFLSRGIISGLTMVHPPFERQTRGIRTMKLEDAFEYFFVFEDLENLDNTFFNLSQLDHIRDKTIYTGKMPVKEQSDLLPKKEVWRLLKLPGKELILMNLGHGLESKRILQQTVQAFTELGLHQTHCLLAVASPYMSRFELEDLQEGFGNPSILITGFFDEFLDAMNHAALTICRAGYNTVVELLLTGCPAIVIPEDYGSGEQSIRACRLPAQGFKVLNHAEVRCESLKKALRDLLNEERRMPVRFDRTKTAETVLSLLLQSEKPVAVTNGVL